MILQKVLNIGFILFLLLSVSCVKKEKEEGGEEARHLFEKSVDLIKNITSGISESADSSSIDSLKLLFEKKIVEINFSVPPETDRKLTEEENDSLFDLMMKMKNQTNKKLESLSRETNDSII